MSVNVSEGHKSLRIAFSSENTILQSVTDYSFQCKNTLYIIHIITSSNLYYLMSNKWKVSPEKLLTRAYATITLDSNTIFSNDRLWM